MCGVIVRFFWRWYYTGFVSIRYDGYMNRRYKELIFTNHALERARQRAVDMGAVWATWRHPQKSRYAATRGAWVKERTWGNRRIEVVVKQNDRKEWVVLSVWATEWNRKPSTPWYIRLLKWVWKQITA